MWFLDYQWSQGNRQWAYVVDNLEAKVKSKDPDRQLEVVKVGVREKGEGNRAWGGPEKGGRTAGLGWRGAAGRSGGGGVLNN